MLKVVEHIWDSNWYLQPAEYVLLLKTELLYLSYMCFSDTHPCSPSQGTETLPEMLRRRQVVGNFPPPHFRPLAHTYALHKYDFERIIKVLNHESKLPGITISISWQVPVADAPLCWTPTGEMATHQLTQSYPTLKHLAPLKHCTLVPWNTFGSPEVDRLSQSNRKPELHSPFSLSLAFDWPSDLL